MTAMRVYYPNGTFNLTPADRTGRFKGQISVAATVGPTAVAVPKAAGERVFAVMTLTDPDGKGKITITSTGFTYEFTAPGTATIHYGVL